MKYIHTFLSSTALHICHDWLFAEARHTLSSLEQEVLFSRFAIAESFRLFTHSKDWQSWVPSYLLQHFDIEQGWTCPEQKL